MANQINNSDVIGKNGRTGVVEPTLVVDNNESISLTVNNGIVGGGGKVYAWLLSGNNVQNDIQKLGTLTNNNFQIITNNIVRGTVFKTGNISLGTANYNGSDRSALLDVGYGHIRVDNGSSINTNTPLIKMYGLGTILHGEFTSGYWANYNTRLYLTSQTNTQNGSSQNPYILKMDANKFLYFGYASVSGHCHLVHTRSQTFVWSDKLNSAVVDSPINAFYSFQHLNDKGTEVAPIMTRSSRIAIVSPYAGLFVYQNDGTQIGLHHYNGTEWRYIPDVQSV